MAFHFAAGCAEYPARGHDTDAGTAGAGLHFCRAQRPRQLLPRQGHHRSVLVPRGIFPQRVALCLPLFPLHARPASCPHRWRLADVAGRPRRRCGNPAARHRKRRRHAAVAGRRVVAVDGRPRPVDPQCSGARRHRRHRGRDPRFRQTRQADRARGDDAVGVRSGGAPGSRPDAGAPAWGDRQPPAVAGERRCAAADDGRRRGPAAALQRRYRLCAPRSAGERQGGDRHRRRRLDRFGDLRTCRHLRRRAVAGDRKFGAGALCGDGIARRARSPAWPSKAASPIFATATACCG